MKSCIENSSTVRFLFWSSNTRWHDRLNESLYHFCKRRGLFNELQCQTITSQQEINDFLFGLRRNKKCETRHLSLLIGINNGLHMFRYRQIEEKRHSFS